MYHPITMLKWSEEQECYEHYLDAHARINTNVSRESTAPGAVMPLNTVTFEVRYNSKIAAIEYDTGSYRIVFNGATFDIQGYDDYLYRHQKIKLIGVGKRAGN